MVSRFLKCCQAGAANTDCASETALFFATQSPDTRGKAGSFYDHIFGSSANFDGEVDKFLSTSLSVCYRRVISPELFSVSAYAGAANTDYAPETTLIRWCFQRVLFWEDWSYLRRSIFHCLLGTLLTAQCFLHCLLNES